MNAVEIEEAVSALAAAPFNAAEFPFQFLRAFGNKETTLKRLRSASTSDIEGGVLQRNAIHIAVSSEGEVGETLAKLRASPKSGANKVKFILATDGAMLEAEDLHSGETLACAYPELANRFSFFLALAGITTTKPIRDNAFDIRATARLNKLYVELLNENPDWGTAARRHDMNHFMARLIFCFFAESTDIFMGDNLFTVTIERMSARDSSNTHEVIGEVFRAMNTKMAERSSANVRSWADSFPYVNGGLFSGSLDVPRFSRIARSYLIHIGNLDWKQINPDIFGSMIQAVAEDEERGALGMHYTSVPNILKVLNPLFLDELRARLEEAGDNPRMLLNLRKRTSKIRVFDPACGSGNFLVIAYKQMREIEAEINKRRGETDRHSDIPLTNFRGIELRDFAAEIARLALIIAEFQCDVLYRGPKLALAEFLPLDGENWITCGNALRLDWRSVCPPTGTAVKHQADDLFHAPLDQTEIDFENEGGETYVCGNPPYFGSKWQKESHKEDLAFVFKERSVSWKSLDYVAGWFMKGADYCAATGATAAFVSTNSICQGQQVPLLWPSIFQTGVEIAFAYTSFKWANLASRNAAVIVVIVGLKPRPGTARRLFEVDVEDHVTIKETNFINAYLISGADVIVEAVKRPLNSLPEMLFGNMPRDAGHLLLTQQEKRRLEIEYPAARRYLKLFQGSEDFTSGEYRGCLWIKEGDYKDALRIYPIGKRLEAVAESRNASGAQSTRQYAKKPYRFVQIQGVAERQSIIVPRHSSENRDYLPVGINSSDVIIADSALAIYDAPIWTLAIIASRIHLVWIATICGKIKTDYRYSNTLGWNTFPSPQLTEKNKNDLTRCAEDILLVRESYFPASVGELYDPDKMPNELRAAHERNDDTLERIYIGRRFRNDTERIEKLFELYTKMIKGQRIGGNAGSSRT